MLQFPGSPALSSFRIDKLRARLAAAVPGVRQVSSRYWHFADVDGALDRDEQRPDPRASCSSTAPRMEAAEPKGHARCWWSRGSGRSRPGRQGDRHRPQLRPAPGAKARARDRATGSTARGSAARSSRSCSALLHDRMTETVLPELEEAARLFAQHAPRPLRDGRRARRRTGGARVRRTASSGLALSPDEIDYLVAALPEARAEPDRRRADDVRAGELRALPAQDLQRATGSSTGRSRTARCSR